MIVMTEEQKRAIDAHGEETYPNECCGIMLGEVLDDGTKVLEELLPVDNSREDGEQYHRFEIKAEDLLKPRRWRPPGIWMSSVSTIRIQTIHQNPVSMTVPMLSCFIPTSLLRWKRAGQVHSLHGNWTRISSLNQKN